MVLSKIRKTGLKEQIINGLQSEVFHDRIKAIQSITKLNRIEAFMFIENILKLEGNLAIKIEALRIIPTMLDQYTAGKAHRILQIALSDDDPEILRNALLSIQMIPPNFINEFLLDSIVKLLINDDTDIQYQAVSTLIYLKSKISFDKFYSYLKPLIKHPNSILRELAQKAILIIVILILLTKITPSPDALIFQV